MPKHQVSLRVGSGWVSVSLWGRNDGFVTVAVHEQEHPSDNEYRCVVPVYIQNLRETGRIHYGTPIQDAILDVHKPLLPQLVRAVVRHTPKAQEILFGTQATASAEPETQNPVLRQLIQFGKSNRTYPVRYKGMEFVFEPTDAESYANDRTTRVMFRIAVKTFIGYDRANELQETLIFIMRTNNVVIENNQLHLNVNVPAADMTLNLILRTIVSSALVRVASAFKETVRNARSAHLYLGLRYDMVQKQLYVPEVDGTGLVRVSEDAAAYVWLRCHGKPGMPMLWFREVHRYGKEHWSPT